MQRREDVGHFGVRGDIPMMKRLELIEVLKKVAPALAAKDLVPAMSCFFFDGKLVSAFDDILAISAPMPTDFKGGLRGHLLLDFLSASRAPEVEFLVEGEEMTVKAGRSKLKIPIVPLDDFKFEWPKVKSEGLKLDETFFKALNQVLPSMGRDPSNPWL